jgi:putative ABC transport system ATP-binding protein
MMNASARGRAISNIEGSGRFAHDPASGAPPLLRVRGEHLAFALAAGDRLALLGPSGVGKTRLLRRLALLDPPGALRILLQERPPAAWTVPRYRHRVMLVSQRTTVFPGTVEANLRLPFQLGVHRHHRFDRQRLLRWLAALGREESFLRLEAEHLSGGEIQLLALLRALQLDPTVLLLDEPTASLDPASGARVEALIGGWLHEGGRALMLTSHDSAQIGRIANLHLELRR